MLETTVVIVKPDAVRDHLEAPIIQDLKTLAGVEILWGKYYTFNAQEISFIYPLWVDRPEFPYMLYNFALGPSLVLVVQGEQAIARVNIQKGKMNGEGIRRKYRRWSREELLGLGFSDEQVNRVIAENRIHSTDTPEAAAEICAFCISPSERTALLQRTTPQFRKLIEKTHALSLILHSAIEP